MFNAKNPHPLPLLPPPLLLRDHPALDKFHRRYHDALQAVSELSGTLKELENPHIFLSTFYLQESVSSNAVENIHTTIESALEDETKPDAERNAPNKEVLNYRSALVAGVSSLQKYGLTSRTIKAVHQKLHLNKGVPGEFRSQQNQIVSVGKTGQPIVLYTPPRQGEIDRLMGNWETFVASDKFLPLVRTAMAHYQFEAIHPFEDGNGRTGRIAMVLQLLADGLLDFPALFLSGYLSEHESTYKAALLDVTVAQAWWDFVDFMLLAFHHQAMKTRLAILQVKRSRDDLKSQLLESSDRALRKSNIATVVDHLFQYPVTHAMFMEEKTNIGWQTCAKYLKALTERKVLRATKTGKYVMYVNRRALEALRA